MTKTLFASTLTAILALAYAPVHALPAVQSRCGFSSEGTYVSAPRSSFAGSTASVKLFTHNTDNASCPLRHYAIQIGVPQGWTVDVRRVDVWLAPGEHLVTELAVTIAGNATGLYEAPSVVEQSNGGELVTSHGWMNVTAR